MDLPEIRNAVAHFLPKEALAAAASVCKEWHASFIPHLYASLDLYTDPGRAPTALTLAMYGHHLKELSLDLIHPQIHAISATCHNLQKLHLVLIDFNSKHRYPVMRLLQSNPRIHDLKIEKYEHSYRETPPNITEDILLRCPAVTSVTLNGVDLSKEDICALWTKSKQLKELRIDGNSPESPEGILESGARTWPTFPNLSFLELRWLVDDLNPDAQVRLIGQCPALKQLRWILPSPESLSGPNGSAVEIKFSQGLEHLFRSARCPLLTSIEVYSPVDHDKYLRIILEHSPARLTHLRTRLFHFTDSALDGWRRHFGTLVYLYLVSSSFKEETRACQIILSSCPRLEKFVGTTLYLSDGPSADPWVCDKLQDLKIRIWTMDNPQMRHEILDRLMQLKNLRSLSIEASSDLFFSYVERDQPSTHNQRTYELLSADQDQDQRLFQRNSSLYRRLHPAKPTQRWIQNAWPKLSHCQVSSQ